MHINNRFAQKRYSIKISRLNSYHKVPLEQAEEHCDG